MGNAKPTYDQLLQRVGELEAEVRHLRKVTAEIGRREELLLEAEELALLGHWELDLASNVLYWSDDIYRIFELDPVRFGATYEAFLRMVHPDDRAAVNGAYTRSLEERTSYDIVHRLLLADGRIKYVHERCRTEYGDDGTPRRSIGTVQDITEQMAERHGFSGIVGREPAMQEVFETIRQVADVTMPVLVQGESGTGKELVAMAIHAHGPRADKPFVPVNCGALPDGLLESELFGHVKGAFTGAVRDKPGRFEMAHEGTLFLDEVVELPRHVQVKLLRVLQTGRFERVGGERTREVDVRIVSAANQDVKQRMHEGGFREDLFYRLNVVPVHVPPLRERRNDIPLLVEHFLDEAAREGRHSRALTREALAELMDYDWPGNVRELRSAIFFALIRARGDVIDVVHLPPDVHDRTATHHRKREAVARRLDDETPRPAGGGRAPRLSAEDVREALAATGGNKKEAARRLGVARATLYRHLKRHSG
jgi:DNA-binding NtrC family response regulator